MEKMHCIQEREKERKNLQDIAHRKFQFLRAILLCKRRNWQILSTLYTIENSVEDYLNVLY